jgi:transcriptional regulator with XRE-family HTH domain
VDLALTNAQVAQILGVAYQTIERWEHDRTPITAKNRQKIIAFIGCDPMESMASPSS